MLLNAVLSSLRIYIGIMPPVVYIIIVATRSASDNVENVAEEPAHILTQAVVRRSKPPRLPPATASQDRSILVRVAFFMHGWHIELSNGMMDEYTGSWQVCSQRRPTTVYEEEDRRQETCVKQQSPSYIWRI